VIGDVKWVVENTVNAFIYVIYDYLSQLYVLQPEQKVMERLVKHHGGLIKSPLLIGINTAILIQLGGME